MAELTNILRNIDNYNNELIISQVVIFFRRHGIEMTKSMIQNYVKLGVLPPPSENRYYTKNHLILLSLIDNLKETYTLEKIKVLLEQFKELLEPEDIYRLFLLLQKEAHESFGSESIKIDNSCLKIEDNKKAAALLTLLAIPTYSKIIKNIINELWDTI